MTIYEPLDSVLSTPALPGAPTLESDVFFPSYQSGALPDDSLSLSPPDPASWDAASAGIFAAAGPTLIDMDPTALCPAPCQPPRRVPLGAAGPLGATLLLVGAACLGWRRRSPAFAGGRERSRSRD